MMLHTLITIGPIGMKKAYLDIPMSAAIKRYESEFGADSPDADNIQLFLFVDEFNVYDAHPPKS